LPTEWRKGDAIEREEIAGDRQASSAEAELSIDPPKLFGACASHHEQRWTRRIRAGSPHARAKKG
jgi:hypothetical protein